MNLVPLKLDSEVPTGIELVHSVQHQNKAVLRVLPNGIVHQEQLVRIIMEELRAKGIDGVVIDLTPLKDDQQVRGDEGAYFRGLSAAVRMRDRYAGIIPAGSNEALYLDVAYTSVDEALESF